MDGAVPEAKVTRAPNEASILLDHPMLIAGNMVRRTPAKARALDCYEAVQRIKQHADEGSSDTPESLARILFAERRQ